jgi:hypothetical protein
MYEIGSIFGALLYVCCTNLLHATFATDTEYSPAPAVLDFPNPRGKTRNTAIQLAALADNRAQREVKK